MKKKTNLGTNHTLPEVKWTFHLCHKLKEDHGTTSWNHQPYHCWYRRNGVTRMHKPCKKMSTYSLPRKMAKTYHLHYTHNLILEWLLYYGLSHNGASNDSVLFQSWCKIGRRISHGPPDVTGWDYAEQDTKKHLHTWWWRSPEDSSISPSVPSLTDTSNVM